MIPPKKYRFVDCAIVDAIGAPVLIATPDERIIHANVAVTRLLGRSSADLVGMKLMAALGLSSRVRRCGTLRVPVTRESGTTIDVELTLGTCRGRRGRLFIVAGLRDLSAHAAAAAAMRDARVEETLRHELAAAVKAATRMERVQRLTSALSQALAPDDVGNVIAREVVASLDGSSTTVHLFDEQDELDLLAECGLPEEVQDSVRHIDRSVGWPGDAVVKAGSPLWAETAEEVVSSIPFDRRRSVLKGTPPQAIACVPFAAMGHPAGLISVAFRQRHSFDDDTRAFLIAVARLCGQAIERARSYERERDSSRVKGEMLAMVSHELRAPLHAILGWSAILQPRVEADPMCARAIDTIQRNARAQSRLVDELLDFSRLLHGRLRVIPQSVHVGKLLASIVESVSPSAAARRITLATHVEHDVGEICADPHRLEQVLCNLLANSMKFTDAGGRIDVHVACRDATIEIRVRDNGCGISPDLLPHVFGRFRQVHTSEVRGREGLGLGLTLTRQLVELHGGVIGASSEGAGRGATFTVRLPRGSPTCTLVPPVVEKPTEGRLQDRRVLVVDDDDGSRDLTRVSLERQGATVKAVAGVEEALAALSRFRPDVVISEVNLHPPPALDFLKRVRLAAMSSGPSALAIALTSDASPDERARAFAAGFQRVLVRPVQIDELVAALVALRPAKTFVGHELR